MADDISLKETKVDTTESKEVHEKDVESSSKVDKEGASETEQSSVDTISKAQVASSDEHGIDQSNLHYEGDVCVYTDPASKYQYVWDTTKNEWVSRTIDAKSETDSDSSKCKSNENETKIEDIKNSSDSSNSETVSTKDYKFDGETYTYTDSQTGISYKYDNKAESWIVKDTEANKGGSVESDSDEDDEDAKIIRQDMTAGYYSYEGDTHLYTDPTDGSVYVWDREKNAWFPKVDDDFLAHYQMSYGFTNPETEEEVQKDDKPVEPEGLKRKLPPKEPSWFEMDQQHNTKVYVTNLPLDITEQEFVDVMQKCGLVMRDVDTGKMKVKLYTEPGTDQPKGDALCTYIKVESVDMALNLLDGYDLRGRKLSVERAQFQMKGDYNPNLKPKKRRKKEKEKVKKMQEKLFDWRPDKLRGERSKHERVVIIKNLFDPKIFDNDVALVLEYRQDLREECSKCGDVRKVVMYDRHAEGVAQVTFGDAEEADICIKLLNGRWFGQRKITAETWDGKTKYKVMETEEEAQQRLKKWSSYLESEEQKDKAREAEGTSTPKMKTGIGDPGEQQPSGVGSNAKETWTESGNDRKESEESNIRREETESSEKQLSNTEDSKTIIQNEN